MKQKKHSHTKKNIYSFTVYIFFSFFLLIMVRSGTNMCLYMYIIMSPELSYIQD